MVGREPEPVPIGIKQATGREVQKSFVVGLKVFGRVQPVRSPVAELIVENKLRKVDTAGDKRGLEAGPEIELLAQPKVVTVQASQIGRS